MKYEYLTFFSKLMELAAMNPVAGQFWPTGRMFGTPGVKYSISVCVITGGATHTRQLLRSRQQ